MRSKGLLGVLFIKVNGRGGGTVYTIWLMIGVGHPSYSQLGFLFGSKLPFAKKEAGFIACFSWI
jgi:hypothetical protein